MDFHLTDEQREVAELAGRIFTDRLTQDVRKQLERGDDRFDDVLWRELATAGILGVAVADDVGGAGQGLL